MFCLFLCIYIFASSLQPPRPLPPDPTVKSVISAAIRSGNKSSPKVSSARERRRRSKQLEGGGVKGRVVLKSRSSSDVSKNSRSTEDLTKHSPSDSVEHNQCRYYDIIIMSILVGLYLGI